jgi:hypothetical protein
MSEQRLTKRQAAIIGAFTGIGCGPFEDIHEYIDSFPQFKGIMTHHFANRAVWKDIKEAVKPDFLAIVYERPETPPESRQSFKGWTTGVCLNCGKHAREHKLPDMWC